MVSQTNVAFITNAHHPTGLDFDAFFPNHLIFVVAAEHNLTPDFYDKDHYYQPLCVTYKIVNMGNSYYLEYMKFVSTYTGKVIQESFFHNVAVDRESHKPSPIPEKFKERMAGITMKLDHPKVQPFPKPDKTLCVQYKVQWSNTDQYYHSNHAEYIRYMKDVIAELSSKGKLKTLKGNLAQYKVKGWKQLYQGETTPGDVLDVHVWENEENPWVLKCHVEKEGKVVHQCSIEFGE